MSIDVIALEDAVYWLMCERSAQMGEAYTHEMHEAAKAEDQDYISDIRFQVKSAIKAYEAAKPDQPDELSQEVTHIRRLVTLVRSSLGRKFQTSDYLPDRFDDENTPPARKLIPEACAEFMEHQKTMHEWAEKAEKALIALEAGQLKRVFGSRG